MRFVQHEGLRTGQDFTETLALDCLICKQKMVVHHHQIGFLRRLPGFHHETFAVERTIGTQTVVGGGGHLWPERGIFGQEIHTGQITAAAAASPGMQPGQLRSRFTRGEQALVAGLIEAIPAKIIGATFEQRGFQARTQSVAHARQIAMVELILQGAGAGGHDGALAREQCRHKVGVGLAGASAGLGDQFALGLDGFGDGLRQALLRRTRRIALDGAGECAILGQRRACGFCQRHSDDSTRYIRTGGSTVQRAICAAAAVAAAG